METGRGLREEDPATERPRIARAATFMTRNRSKFRIRYATAPVRAGPRRSMKADQLLAPVMIVDDNDDDVTLFSRHLKTAGVKNPVLHFRNGGDAFMFLKQFCPPASTRVQMPTVLFLDVNMQGLSGFDVLVWARQQPVFAQMKVYMLSGAREEFDAQIAG